MWIHIDEVLLNIKRSNGNPFRIVFYRATGPNKGITKAVSCIYGTSISKKGPNSADHASKQSFKDDGRLPLLDSLNKTPITPYIRLIVGFEGKKVNH